MRIDIPFDKKTINEIIVNNICPTEQYRRMDYREKYTCSYDYYGDITDDGFILTKTSRGVRRNGVQHLTVRGVLIEDKDRVVLSVKPVFNGAHFIISAILLSTIMYSVLTDNLFVIIAPCFFSVIAFFASLYEYNDACLFLSRILCDE